MVEIIPDHVLAFYSRLFLVEKVTGEWRPILDLVPLNSYVALLKFRIKMVLPALSPFERETLFSIDMKDAYFQIPILPESKPFLLIVVDENTHHMKVLYSGFLQLPWVFTRLFALVYKWYIKRTFICFLCRKLNSHYRLSAPCSRVLLSTSTTDRTW